MTVLVHLSAEHLALWPGSQQVFVSGIVLSQLRVSRERLVGRHDPEMVRKENVVHINSAFVGLLCINGTVGCCEDQK